MKYSNYIGAVSATLLIAYCFVPWVYIESIHTTITGLSAEHTNFGRPGILHIILSVVAILLFLLPFSWAKRTNLFVCTLNFAYSVRNFLIITRCELGDCPEKHFGIYAVIIFSILMLVMSLLPKVKLDDSSYVK